MGNLALSWSVDQILAARADTRLAFDDVDVYHRAEGPAATVARGKRQGKGDFLGEHHSGDVIGSIGVDLHGDIFPFVLDVLLTAERSFRVSRPLGTSA
jgi:hypothetical protein